MEGMHTRTTISLIIIIKERLRRHQSGKGKGPCLYYLCSGPHQIAECPQKRALNALTSMTDHKSQTVSNDSEEDDCRFT